MKNIAVQGCSLELTDKTLAGLPQITTAPSSTTKADGKPAYRGNLTVSVPIVTDTAGNVAADVTLTISGSSQKTKIDGQAAVLEGDSGTAKAVVFTHPTTGVQATHDVEARIASAGQSKSITE